MFLFKDAFSLSALYHSETIHWSWIYNIRLAVA